MSDSVLNTVKRAVANCITIREPNQRVKVDFSESVIGDLSIFPVGPTFVKRDVLGNPVYKLVLTLYSQLSTFNDYDMANNATFMSNLTYSLNKLKRMEIEESLENYLYFNEFTRFSETTFFGSAEKLTGKILSLDAGNGLKYDYPTGDANDGARYQIQITVTYKLNVNELFEN